MIEQWKPIPDFPGYSVSDWGRIRSEKSGRILSPFENQFGLVCIGMVQGGIQKHRSVPRLVAKAFMPNDSDVFDTPINLDGNRHNNSVWNLAWRPRWFAIKYNQQFRNSIPNRINRPIEDVATGDVSKDSFHCATKYGLLEEDVIVSILNNTYVWPTYQELRVHHK